MSASVSTLSNASSPSSSWVWVSTLSNASSPRSMNESIRTAGSWADEVEMDNEDDTMTTENRDVPPCTPHFYPDPSRRVLKEGDIMYFIRRPWYLGVVAGGSLPVGRSSSIAVQGLDAPLSLERLCDPEQFLTRMMELEEIKEDARQDTSVLKELKEAVAPVVKRRKLQDGKAHNADAENVAPKAPKSGSAKRAAPHIKEKASKANEFLDFYGLPENSHVQKNALAVVIKNLRGELRSRISNAKKPKNMKGPDADAQLAEQQLGGAATEVAKYLVAYKNNPECMLGSLEQTIVNQGPACIHKIREWLACKELDKLSDEAMSQIYESFKRQISQLLQNVEKETRYNLIKSMHKLRCTKVSIGEGSKLLGCYSGAPQYVQAQLQLKGEEQRAEEVKHKPTLCKDLRKQGGINIVAILSEEDGGSFKAMPGPLDPYPKGFIFLGCEICQGNTEGTDCNCTDWLEKEEISKTDCEPGFEFELDEMIVPGHLDNFCFGAKRWGGSQGILNLRQFTADEDGEGGVQIVGLTSESRDSK